MLRPPYFRKGRFLGRMAAYDQSMDEETFNPWSIVNLVFHHLASEGLHRGLGAGGDPGAPAADLLRALGITPAAEGNRQASEKVKQQLAELRAAFDVSHVESS
jgi:hypothetical protein